MNLVAADVVDFDYGVARRLILNAAAVLVTEWVEVYRIERGEQRGGLRRGGIEGRQLRKRNVIQGREAVIGWQLAQETGLGDGIAAVKQTGAGAEHKPIHWRPGKSQARFPIVPMIAHQCAAGNIG